ncbi:MAG: hypothetical protein ACRBFS_19920 [Aureispira sp.]
MSIQYRLLLFFALLGFVACDNTPPKPDPIFTNKMNLLEYGIPVTLLAPEGATVKNNSDNFMQDVVVEGKDYYVQIYGSNATSLDCAKLTQESLLDYKTTDAAFKGVVQQDPCSFLYKVEVDNDTTTSYNFAYFAIRGNKVYTFSTTAGPLTDFSQDEVTAIYEAVKAQE